MQNEEALKKPPFSMEAEQSVLGGLLLDNGRWDDVSDKVAGTKISPPFYSLFFLGGQVGTPLTYPPPTLSSAGFFLVKKKKKKKTPTYK